MGGRDQVRHGSHERGVGLPGEADAGPDAELIAACDQLVQLRTHELAVFRQSDDDEATDDALAITDAEWNTLADRVGQIDRPETLDGAKAMARCVLRHSNRCPGGDIVMIDLAQRMAIRVSEFLAGSAVA